MDTPQDKEKEAAPAAPVSSAATVDMPKADALNISSAASSIFQRVRASAGATLAGVFAARPRLSRVTVLTTAIALSAALGSMVGAWAAVVFVKPAADPIPTIIAHAERDTVARLAADIADLKASIDNLGKNSATQYARISERIEGNEKAQGEPAAKIARLSDAVEKLERKTAATAPSPEITGSIVPKQQDKPPVVTGWVLREVFDGSAMVESRYGLYEVVPGANLPGLGRVETIRRQDGRWVVVTPKGVIVSSR